MKLEASLKQGYFFEINIKDLGEFKFLFSDNEDVRPGTNKFFVECFWNPPNYGLVDHIVGYYCEEIEKEMDRITEDMSYFIDGARVSCVCRIEDGHDDEGVYEGILDMWFSDGENMN